MSNIAEHAQAFADKPALIDGPTGAQMTYAELNRRSIQCARLFKS